MRLSLLVVCLGFLATTSAQNSSDPDSVMGPISDLEVAEARRPLPPVELSGKPLRRDWDVRGDGQTLYEQVSAAYGLQVVFDGGYQPVSSVRFRAEDAGWQEALRMLQGATDTFLIPIGPKLMMVARDTTQKRAELESTMSVVVPVPEPVTVQEIQEIAAAVRGTFDIQRLMVDSNRRLLLMRDRVSKVRPAQALVASLLQFRPQVAVELDLLAVGKTSSLHYGISLPTSVAVVDFGHFASNLQPAPPPAGFARFLTFGGGKTFLGLGIADAGIFASLSKTSSRTLMHSELVMLDGQPAQLHVGDKYPIQSNVYLGNTTGTGQAFTPPPTFTFEDLGLLVKITPHVHGEGEVTLEVEAEFKLLGGGSFNGIPVISNRKFQSKVRLVDGQWAVLAGLVSGTFSQGFTGIPGLAQIPAIGKLLRDNTKDTDENETLLVLKPHLLSIPPLPSTAATWVGSESRPKIRL